VLDDEAWSRFGSMAPGYRRVQAICDYVHGHLTFQYGSTTALSSAVDVNLAGRGVCRDFTHLAISFCRALNIPARYVFGYLPDMDVPPDPAPMDFAAWMEAWLGSHWWTFDPRNNARREGRVVIGQRQFDLIERVTCVESLQRSLSTQPGRAPGKPRLTRTRPTQHHQPDASPGQLISIPQLPTVTIRDQQPPLNSRGGQGRLAEPVCPRIGVQPGDQSLQVCSNLAALCPTCPHPFTLPRGAPFPDGRRQVNRIAKPSAQHVLYRTQTCKRRNRGPPDPPAYRVPDQLGL